MSNSKTPNIFFQNGMMNNFNGALGSGNLIKDLTGREVGLIVNNTHPSISAGGDTLEYLPNSLYLKDALNGEVYQQIASNNTKNKSLIIAHSAGNEDAIKSARVLKLNNVNLNGMIDFASVGSPASLGTLKRYLESVGINVIGQYNNWLDPVTNFKAWAVGTVGLAVGSAFVGTAIGAASASTGVGLEALFNAGLGGVAGFGSGKVLLTIQHPFQAYFDKDYKGLKTDIRQWSVANPAVK